MADREKTMLRDLGITLIAADSAASFSTTAQPRSSSAKFSARWRSSTRR
jgi:hypothetical protein